MAVSAKSRFLQFAPRPGPLSEERGRTSGDAMLYK